MKVRLQDATFEDAADLAELRNEVAARLTVDHGKGHWSSQGTPQGVVYAIRTSRVFVVRSRGKLLGTLRLATKKPWAIDAKCFTKVARPLYLLDMAVTPARQRKGLGRAMLEQADLVARDWPADAIRLDAYDAAAGAGGFYASCGYRETGRAVYRKTPLIYFEKVLS